MLEFVFMRPYAVHAAEQLPALLKAFRKEAGLTQGEVAARLGVTQQTLSALERNAQKVSAERLLHLLGILGVDMVLQEKPVFPDNESQPIGGTSQW
jgi:HTH-type transcriptional regulator/antitoxin HipB